MDSERSQRSSMTLRGCFKARYLHSPRRWHPPETHWRIHPCRIRLGSIIPAAAYLAPAARSLPSCQRSRGVSERRESRSFMPCPSPPHTSPRRRAPPLAARTPRRVPGGEGALFSSAPRRALCSAAASPTQTAARRPLLPASLLILYIYIYI